jgi:hypothetical protein
MPQHRMCELSLCAKSRWEGSLEILHWTSLFLTPADHKWGG